MAIALLVQLVYHGWCRWLEWSLPCANRLMYGFNVMAFNIAIISMVILAIYCVTVDMSNTVNRKIKLGDACQNTTNASQALEVTVSKTSLSEREEYRLIWETYRLIDALSDSNELDLVDASISHASPVFEEDIGIIWDLYCKTSQISKIDELKQYQKFCPRQTTIDFNAITSENKQLYEESEALYCAMLTVANIPTIIQDVEDYERPCKAAIASQSDLSTTENIENNQKTGNDSCALIQNSEELYKHSYNLVIQVYFVCFPIAVVSFLALTAIHYGLGYENDEDDDVEEDVTVFIGVLSGLYMLLFVIVFLTLFVVGNYFLYWDWSWSFFGIVYGIFFGVIILCPIAMICLLGCFGSCCEDFCDD
jgi:uncharacterized membrane protein